LLQIAVQVVSALGEGVIEMASELYRGILLISPVLVVPLP
jgi:hypothetical protein